MASMSIFIALSLCYGFVGVILIALYAGYDETQNTSIFSFVFSSKQYKIYFMILIICSFIVLLWQDISAVYVILMFLLLLGIIDIKCLALPDMLNFFLLFICVIYALLDSTMTGDSFVHRVLFGFGVGGIFFILKIFYQSLSSRDIIGEADIIVLSSLGIAFGAFSAFVSVFLGSIVALLYAIFLNLFLKHNLFSIKLPFCFFIFVGTILYFVWLDYGGIIYA